MWLIGDELRQKIRMEKREIERLHQDIIELRMIREDMSDSDRDVSSSSSSDDSDDDDDDELQEILEQLIHDNKELEVQSLFLLMLHFGIDAAPCIALCLIKKVKMPFELNKISSATI